MYVKFNAGLNGYFKEIKLDFVDVNGYLNKFDNQTAVDLFEDDNPIGESVKLNYNGRIFQFTVIGVMKEKGGSMAGNLDEWGYIPLLVAMDRLTAHRYVDSIVAQAYSSETANFNGIFKPEQLRRGGRSRVWLDSNLFSLTIR